MRIRGDPQREPGGVWVVPGDFPVDELPRLFGEEVGIDGEYEATTLGGLVSEIEGRIPLPGEVVLLGDSGYAHPGCCLYRSARRSAAHLSAC